MDENNFFKWLLEGLMAALMALGGWIMNGIHARTERNTSDIASFKEHVANTYSKETDMQAALLRLEERSDANQHDIRSTLTIIQNDIKTLIAKVK